MTANVSIITNERIDVICVPNIALKFTPNTDGQKYKTQGIWILDKNKPKRIDIEAGASDDTSTEVNSKEIAEGDKVITGILGKNSKNKQNMRRGPRMF